MSDGGCDAVAAVKVETVDDNSDGPKIVEVVVDKLGADVAVAKDVEAVA